MTSTRRKAKVHRSSWSSRLLHRLKAAKPRFGTRLQATREQRREARRDVQLYVAAVPWIMKPFVWISYGTARLGPGLWLWGIFGVFVVVMSVWALGIDIDALWNECAKYGSCAGGEE